MRKVLMVAYHYPPWSGGSGIHRTLKFSKYLPEFGWQPIILTAERRAYFENGVSPCAVPMGVEVERAFALDTARHLSFRGTYLRWMALPDRWISWWMGAVASGRRLIRQHRPDLIWSTFPIATAQLIGLTLHRLSRIPWVADFRDPMTEVDPRTGQQFPEDPVVRRVNGWIEAPAIKSCQRAVFTTPGLSAMYAQRFAELPERHWCVIPNGYDDEDFLEAERAMRPHRPNGGPAVLVHSGVLYPVERDPTCFFAALSDLKKAGTISSASLRIILRACGSEALYRPQLQKLGIDDIVFLEPTISHRESLVEMLAADGLLIFQASNCNRQIPAKAYECLRAKRPIFAMTDRMGDTAALLQSEGVQSIVALDSKDEISAGLLNFLGTLSDGRNLPRFPESHSRQARTRDLATLFDSLV